MKETAKTFQDLIEKNSSKLCLGVIPLRKGGDRGLSRSVRPRGNKINQIQDFNTPLLAAGQCIFNKLKLK